jgi:tetratricopeptide (TPR) repeat protein
VLAAVLEESPRARRRLLGVVALLAAAFRLLYVAEIHADPYWRTPLVDAADYHTRAMQVMRGEGLGPAVYYKAPAYAFLVGQLYRVTGPRLEVVYALQMLGGALGAMLVAALAWRWYGPLAALVAGVLCGSYASLPYYENQLLVESVALFAAVGSVFLLCGPSRSRAHPATGAQRAGWSDWRRIGLDLLAGAAAGLALQLRPLDAALVVALCLVLVCTTAPPVARLRRVVCVLAPVLLLLVPTMRHNRLASGQLVPVSVNGGINFYIGNNADYDATVAIRPGLRWEELTQRFDAMNDPVRWQRNFYAASFAWMRAHPGDALALFLKKLVLFWNRAEIDRNQDSRAMRGGSWVLRWLGTPWTALAVLGLVGLALRWREWRRRPLHFLVLVQMLGVVAFFVTARYRLAVVPWLAIAAGGAVVEVQARAARAGRRALAGTAAGLALALCLVVPGWYGASRADFGRPEFELAEVLARRGDREGALHAYEKAVARHPDDPDVRFRFGEQLERCGRADVALGEYRRASALAPWSYKPPLALGAALLQRGDLAGAWAALAEAERRGDPHGRTQYDMGLVRERQGDFAAALELYRKSLQLPDDGREMTRRRQGAGRSLMGLGRTEEAAVEFAAAGPDSALEPPALAPASEKGEPAPPEPFQTGRP